jgi:aldose sugar dehydrogenase
MGQKKCCRRNGIVLRILSVIILAVSVIHTASYSNEPTILNPNLLVKTVVDGLSTPTSMAFIGTDEFLVLEKNTGKVQRIVGGEIHSTVLDLAVNFGSERGLLGIALHPGFPTTPWVYLYWTESSTGEDTNVLSNTLLLGNRVDRFVWDGSSLTFAQNLIHIRALQNDNGQPERGNHNGGVLRFGPDGKLYVFIGDVGRRGQMQNLPCGPTVACPGPTVPDDQYGGPEPDDAHLTGVILRLNDDGSSPVDNPFYSVGSAMGGEVGENIQKIFSYGHRNSFGMAFDPRSGDLWLAENGDDSFSELNRVLPGMNGGWVQIMGPVERIGQYKEIETSTEYFGLQQIRWSPENIADTPEEAISRLFMLPGAHYADPELSWKYEVSPAALGFAEGRGLGPQLEGNMFIGAARDFLEGGHLYSLKLNGNRRKIVVNDGRLKDGVADNLDKWDLTESESMLIGRDFGISTDILTGPNGNLYIVSLSHGAIYEIFRKPQPGKGKELANNSLEDDFTDLSSSSLNFMLFQNYPNPFNPHTRIRYALSENSHVRLEIIDVMGRRVALLADEEQEAGWYEIPIDASHLASGLYLYRLQAGAMSETKVMTIMK